MASKKILLTPEGLAELSNELQQLKEVKRVEIAEKLKEAISYGDLSENAEYQEARDDQAQVELRIAELEEILKPGNYELIEDEKKSKKKKGINVGNTVKLTSKDEDGKKDVTYTIVGSQEANIFENKISNESPIGRSLIGKEVWETANVTPPSGKTTTYTIIEVA